MKDQNSSFRQDLPWETEDLESETNSCGEEYYGEAVHCAPWEPALSIDEVGRLLDRMVMDIQHLELEVIRARYKLSFFLVPPYDEYLRAEIFGGMGTRYGGATLFMINILPTVVLENTMTQSTRRST